jgi:hypothetical protein
VSTTTEQVRLLLIVFGHGLTNHDLELSTSLMLLLKDTSAFATSADRIILPLPEASSITIYSLANDISQWIMGSGTGLPSSKLALLCSPVFQSLSKEHLGDGFTKSFRLLIWATTLLSSTTAQPGLPAYVQAETRLTRLVSCLGNTVIPEVDRLCKYSNLKSHSQEQRLLLFLVLTGLCLAASYIRPGVDNRNVSYHS